MFTGLVQAMGTVRDTNRTEQGLRLVIDPMGWDHQPAPGDSIAVDGCCLTVAGEPSDSAWVFQAVPETLTKTTLGDWAAGRGVNLEHAATLQTLLGGHLVQGHVDGVGRVLHVPDSAASDWRVRIAPGEACMPYLVPKGSVCVSGVSLTIAALDAQAGWFEVALIPETLARTNLAALSAGATVNIECDPIGKQIVEYLRRYQQQPGA